MYQDIILFWDLQVSFPLQTQSILVSAFRLYILARELTKSKYVCQHWWDGVVGRRWDFSRLGTGLWSRWYWLGCCRLARWVVERMDQLSCHQLLTRSQRAHRFLHAPPWFEKSWHVQLPWPEWCKTIEALVHLWVLFVLSSHWLFGKLNGDDHASKAVYYLHPIVYQVPTSTWLVVSLCFLPPVFLSLQDLPYQCGLKNVQPPSVSNSDVKAEMQKCQARFWW